MTFRPDDIERAKIYLLKLFEGGKSVRIDPITEIKRINQVRYVWLILTHAAFETGSDKNNLYQLFLNRFPTIHEVKDLMGNVELVPVSMSQFSKVEMSVFIEYVAVELRSNGFDVPDPEDKKVIEMYNFYHNRGLI